MATYRLLNYSCLWHYSADTIFITKFLFFRKVLKDSLLLLLIRKENSRLGMIGRVNLTDDAFFSTGTGLERVGVVEPDLDCWRAGLQALESSGLR